MTRLHNTAEGRRGPCEEVLPSWRFGRDSSFDETNGWNPKRCIGEYCIPKFIRRDIGAIGGVHITHPMSGPKDALKTVQQTGVVETAGAHKCKKIPFVEIGTGQKRNVDCVAIRHSNEWILGQIRAVDNRLKGHCERKTGGSPQTGWIVIELGFNLRRRFCDVFCRRSQQSIDISDTEFFHELFGHRRAHRRGKDVVCCATLSDCLLKEPLRSRKSEKRRDAHRSC
ncbi:unannotated protein [freshwater metagenome]|uniref:Unannotated protein n=1 Tax=freshwater metagenome TaxID=449393 RepID=A0A6J6JJU6_9ZZZZ